MCVSLSLSLLSISQIEAAITSCSEQILAFIKDSLAAEQLPPLSEAQQTQLRSQLEQLANKTSPVRTLMCKCEKGRGTLSLILM